MHLSIDAALQSERPASTSAPCDFIAGDLPTGTDTDTATSLRRSCSTGGELYSSPTSSSALHYTLCSRCPANPTGKHSTGGPAALSYFSPPAGSQAGNGMSKP